MSELGQRLKSKREEKNISLDELQNLTKIQKRYLRAIEEGNFDQLPGDFYARAFVKNYAEAVGFDPEMIFEEHANELPNSNKQASDIPPRVQTKKTRGTKKTRRVLAMLPTVVAFVFIITIFIGIWYFLQDNEIADNGIQNENTPAPVEGGRDDDALASGDEEPENDEEPIVEDEEETEEELPQQEFILVDTVRNETIFDLVNAAEFQVKIELQGKCYVGIDNQKGKSFHAANVDAGKTLTFDFSEEESIHFNFGASGNVNLIINDELFEFPQNIAHQKVTIHFQRHVDES